MTHQPWRNFEYSSTAELIKEKTLFCRYVGTDGIYTHTVEYERDPACLICSSGVPLHAPTSSTLQQACSPLLLQPTLTAAVRHLHAGLAS